MRRNHFLAYTAWLSLLATGCGSDTDSSGAAGDTTEPGTMTQRFVAFNNPDLYLAAKVKSGIRVCLTGDAVNAATRANYETTIRDAAMKWVDAMRPSSKVPLMRAENITFSCENQDITVNWHSGNGRANAGATTMNLYGNSFPDVVVHEFGHSFGLGDTYIEDVWTCQPGQENSVMCSSGGVYFADPQHDDINGIQEVFAILFENDSKRRWSSTTRWPWCAGPNHRLHVGDFNGDAHDDMLCHDVGNGFKWLDLADDSDQFGSGDWQGGEGWCQGNSQELHVGDFNGDGRDDLLCHDVNTGEKWVDLAADSGSFGNGGWSGGEGWCQGNSEELHVGDFNGDGRDDLLCHDVNTGEKWVDLADNAGSLGNGGWSGGEGWCRGNSQELHVGDFNGDGRDDLLCHDVGTGEKWVDLAGAAGSLGNGGWSGGEGWCHGDSQELHVGDFNATQLHTADHPGVRVPSAPVVPVKLEVLRHRDDRRGSPAPQTAALGTLGLPDSKEDSSWCVLR